jgi:hypothetical protein
MWPLIDKQAIVIYGSLELNRLEKVVCTRAGKNADTLSGWMNFLFQVSVDLDKILVDAFPLRRFNLECFGALRKFLTHKNIVIVLTMLVSLGIEIQTYHWEILWLESG